MYLSFEIWLIMGIFIVAIGLASYIASNRHTDEDRRKRDRIFGIVWICLGIIIPIFSTIGFFEYTYIYVVSILGVIFILLGLLFYLLTKFQKVENPESQLRIYSGVFVITGLSIAVLPWISFILIVIIAVASGVWPFG